MRVRETAAMSVLWYYESDERAADRKRQESDRVAIESRSRRESCRHAGDGFMLLCVRDGRGSMYGAVQRVGRRLKCPLC